MFPGINEIALWRALSTRSGHVVQDKLKVIISSNFSNKNKQKNLVLVEDLSDITKTPSYEYFVLSIYSYINVDGSALL